MAASTITRSTWVNDSGTPSAPVGDGTSLNNAALQNDVYARIDAMFAGAGAYTTFELGGKLAVDGFGQHNFSSGGSGPNIVAVRNTSAGTANYSAVYVGNDTSQTNLYIQGFSSTFTTSGPSVANGGSLIAENAGGLSIGAVHASGVIRFYTGGTTERGQIETGGGLTWTFKSASAENLNFTWAVNGSGFMKLFNGTGGASSKVGLELLGDSTQFAAMYLNATGYSGSTFDVAASLVINAPTAFVTGGINYNGNSHTFWGGSKFLQSGFHFNVGATTYPGRSSTNPTNAINIYDGTAPAGTLANGVTLYSQAGKLWAMDASGAATKLTP